MAGDPLGNIRIVLCETAHPGNIGAAARALKTMGLVSLYLVAPGRFPDPQSEWLASGAADVLANARVCATLDEALAGSAFTVACTSRMRGIAVPMVSAREAAARAIEVARRQPATLVFGNETFGLTAAEVNRCHLLAAIPANPRYASLNVAAAVQVFAYELRMASGAAEPRQQASQPATHEQIERFYRRAKEGREHDRAWIDACKGGPKPSSNFDYGGPLTELVLLGQVLELRARRATGSAIRSLLKLAPSPRAASTPTAS